MKTLFTKGMVWLLIVVAISCKNERLRTANEDLPTLTTNVATSITSQSATSGGDISSEGGSAVTARGVCWSTASAPTVDDAKTKDGSGAGSFTSSITGLLPSTTYYVRSYAINTAGTAYGNEVSFTTSATGSGTVGLATVTTANVQFNASTNTAQSGGSISSAGTSAISARGVCWSTSINPTINDNKTVDGSGTGNFSSTLTGLAPNTAYYVRAYATNNSGTAYGDHEIFSTSATSNNNIPVVTTSNPVFNPVANTAQSGGNVISAGSSAVTARGVCWSTSANPTINNSKTTDGTGPGIFTSNISGLAANTAYYVRAYATNSAGTAYGNQLMFSTTVSSTPGLAVLTTTTATFNAVNNSISTGGNITADGGSAVTARGVVWGTSSNPIIAGNKTTDGSGTGTFTSSINGLAANTTYYVRAYATNSTGTSYGNELIVSSSTSTGSFTIGQSYGGGIIFYIDASGQHGLIAATQDQGSGGGTRWDYRNNSSTTGANSTTNGKSNTDKIIAALGNSQTYAAAVCRNYNGGGFTDWYLPARNELNLLFQKRTEVGGFNLSSGEYWSSTEDDADKAWMQEFESGSNSGRQDDENKDKNLLVRPIRSF